MPGLRFAWAVATTVAALAALPGSAAAVDPPAVDEQPLVFNTTFSPDALPSSGGVVNVTADVIEDVALQLVYVDVVGSDGSVQSPPLSLLSGITWGGPVTLPPNTTALPITYQITAWAQDTSLNFGGDPVGAVTVAPPLAAGLLKAPDKVGFGDTRVGAARQKAIVIRDDARKQDPPIQFDITTTGYFRPVGPTRFTLRPGEKATAVVEFRPLAAGSQVGSLLFMRADGGQPGLAVALSGKAQR